MPWRIGIDEAGYGPNLGPFVMSAVACRVPEALLGANLWSTLRRLVRRAHHQADSRVLIDDSKKVYAGGKGLAELEIAALLALNTEVTTLEEILPLLSPACHAELQEECWFTGATPLPLAADADALPARAARWKEQCAQHEVVWLRPRSEIVCTPRVNALIDRHDSKGAVLALSFVRLVQALLEQAPDEDVYITVDKHGGRSYYAPLLQDAFADGWVVTREETQRQSTYEVLGLGRTVRITFRVEDGSEMTVAARLDGEQVRAEALMGEWNAFWQKEVPGLKPTAGYPGDAQRFFGEIGPVVKRLRLSEEILWRKR
ncbi:MAG: hypothetical protein U0793_22655 [Gemmataceae bacterium]